MVLFDSGSMELFQQLLPLIIILMVIDRIMPKGTMDTVRGLMNTSMIIKERHRNEVKNDGTDRDYASLVRSCKATPTMAKWLYSDTTGDRDLISRKWGRVKGISARLTFTAILLKVHWAKRPILVLTPNEFLTTVDRPTIQIKARGLVNLAEVFYFAEPLRSSEWKDRKEQYWKKCFSFLDEVAKERMSIDGQGDMDFQLKLSMREKEEKAYDELVNAKMRRKTAPREDMIDETPS